MTLRDEESRPAGEPSGIQHSDQAGSAIESDPTAAVQQTDQNFGMGLFPQHAAMLTESGITAEHARLRGYRSQDTKKRLHDLGIAVAGCKVPGLLVPLLDKNSDVWGHQYRPDEPRQRGGKLVKYESPMNQCNRIDVPPGVGPSLADPSVPLWITEGSKKADSAVQRARLACVALLGVYGWRGRNAADGVTALADWEDIALKNRLVVLAFDSDVMRNPMVRAALDRLDGYLRMKGARVQFCHLPDDGHGKTGLDDYLAAGHTASELWALVRDERPAVVEAAAVDPALLGDQPESKLMRKHWRLAAQYAVEHHDKLLHVVGLGWHYWDGKRWARDDGDVRATRAVAITIRRAWVASAKMPPGDAQQQFRADIIGCETASGTRGLLDLARVMNGMTATIDDMDADPYLLNTASGTLDLRTTELRTHDPKDRLTRITRGGYSKDAARPVFDGFMERVLPDAAVRSFVQRLIGSALLGVVREHILAIFTGTGQNGKTTLVEAVGGALGSYYAAGPPGLLSDATRQHPTELMTLLGRRLVTLAETDKGAAMSVERMKRLTGGDKISARLLFRDFVEFTPSHTSIMITNHLPQVPGDDPAVWRRLRVVLFGVAIPDAEKDVQLPERLELEADGILSWAVEGYRAYEQLSGLAEPPGVLAETQKYHDESDLVQAFLDDCCTVEPGNSGYFAFQAGLWDAWQTWCRNNKFSAGRQRDFVLAIERRQGIERRKTKHGLIFYGLAVAS